VTDNAQEPKPNALAGATLPAEAETEDDRAARHFDIPGMYRGDLRDSMNRLGDLTGGSKDELDEIMRETAMTFYDAKIPPLKASSLHSLMVHHLRTPADEDTEQEWTVQTRRQLRERYGDDAPKRLEKVREFVSKRPALEKLLTETGLGSHPDVVLALAENANQLRLQPRPPKKK
jgi:hypothetical protein